MLAGPGAPESVVVGVVQRGGEPAGERERPTIGAPGAGVESGAAGAVVPEPAAPAPAPAATGPPGTAPCEPAARRRCRPPSWPAVQEWLLTWHLVLLLGLVIIVGVAWPPPGAWLNSRNWGGVCLGRANCVWGDVASLCVTIIFLLSGLGLKTDAVINALREWKGTLFGVVSILFLSPCLSFALATGNFGGVPEFALGLALFAAVPTTLSSGPIITGQAKGNVPLALVLTVLTNVLGVFTTPIFVAGFLGTFLRGEGAGSLRLDPVPMIVQLVFTILVPLVVGKVLADCSPWVRAQCKRFKTPLKLFSSLLLATIPWMKISGSADALRTINASAFFSMWFAGMGSHCLLLVLNFAACHYVLRLNPPEESAVVIIASQKTLPVAVSILALVPTTEYRLSAGLVAIPIVVCHVSQIFIDSFVASRYAAAADRCAMLKDAEPAPVDAADKGTDKDGVAAVAAATTGHSSAHELAGAREPARKEVQAQLAR